MTYILGVIAAYLLGSIPVGFLLARAAGRGDIRKVGSGGTGATNVMRVGGFKLAGLTWILDMAKSVAAVFLGYRIAGLDFAALCGFFSVIGHCWPVWLRFRGGKGISSMFGVMLGVSPAAFAFVGIEWLLVALSGGYSSLGAVVAFLVMPVFGFAIGMNVGLAFCGISAICLWRHRENIRRLMSGTESKIEWRWKK